MTATAEPVVVNTMMESMNISPQNEEKVSRITDREDDDEIGLRLRNEALAALKEEPELQHLLNQTVLAPHVKTFEDAVATTVSYRLLSGNNAAPCSLSALREMISAAFDHAPDYSELGHSMKYAVRQDALAVLQRDPACQTILEVVLFFKGFASLVCHRAARHLFLKKQPKRSMLSLFLQSQASAVFGVDIHPLTQIGAGVMLDHGTGVVMGETAVIGDGCTLLHGVTLGGTGKERGDRHPKVGKHVLVGAGANILGNVQIGDNAKIGAGSIVLRSIPSGATAVGAPARIIGRVKEPDPASTVDEVLQGVNLIQKDQHHHHPRKSHVFRVDSTLTATTVSSETESDDEDDEIDDLCPFRDLRRLGRNAPPNTVTFCTLYKLLSPHGQTSCQIGEVYFAMDKEMVGYVSVAYFATNAAKIIHQYTDISQEECERLVKEFVKQLKQETTKN